MLAKIYRKLVPAKARKSIYDRFLGRVVYFFRNFKLIMRSKLTYVFGFMLPKTELNKIYAFMGRYGITSYPYPYMLEYKNREIKVEHDAALNMPYVNHNGKKLYFPDFYTVEKVKKDYRALITEQDPRAAHRYVRSYDELRDRVLLDVGSAEAIFSLDTIELTRKVIIFECEEYWHKPLRATFAGYENKVTIVKKYVGDKTTGDFVTIDDFLPAGERDDLFIKMDIEGAERMALAGAAQTLQTGKNIAVAVCTYHRPDDPAHMQKLLTGYGFSVEFSDGYMYWGKRISKAVIRGKK